MATPIDLVRQLKACRNADEHDKLRGRPAKALLGYAADFAPWTCEPTAARPGSPEKIETLRQRYEDGQELHHSADAHCHSEVGERSRVILLCDVLAAYHDASPSGSRSAPTATA